MVESSRNFHEILNPSGFRQSTVSQVPPVSVGVQNTVSNPFITPMHQNNLTLPVFGQPEVHSPGRGNLVQNSPGPNTSSPMVVDRNGGITSNMNLTQGIGQADGNANYTSINTMQNNNTSGETQIYGQNVVPTFAPIISPNFKNRNPYAGSAFNNTSSFSSYYVPSLTQGNSVQNSSLTESVRLKKEHLLRLLNSADRIPYAISKLRKSDFPSLPSSNTCNYYKWRQMFLMQAQASGNLNVYFDKNFIPQHIQFPAPAFSDPYYEGNKELMEIAELLQQTLARNHDTIISFLATVMVHVLQNNSEAIYLIQSSAIDPAQIFYDLDQMYIKHGMLTKSTFIRDFYALHRDQRERFSSFLARVDAARADLMVWFQYNISDEDYLAVLQGSLLPEMFPTFFSMIKEAKPLSDIKRDMMSIETALLKNAKHHAHLSERVRDFTESRWDKQHVRFDSPQRQQFRRGNRFHDRRSPTPGPTSYSSTRHTYQRGSSPGFTRGRWDAQRDNADRSRSRSPYGRDVSPYRGVSPRRGISPLGRDQSLHSSHPKYPSRESLRAAQTSHQTRSPVRNRPHGRSPNGSSRGTRSEAVTKVSRGGHVAQAAR